MPRIDRQAIYVWLPGVGRVQAEGHVAMTGVEYESLLASEGVCRSCIHFQHEQCKGCACTEQRLHERFKREGPAR